MNNETTTWNIWLSNLLTLSGLSVEELEPIRKNVLIWYRCGENFDTAAETAKLWIKLRKEEIRKQEMAEKDTPKRLFAHAIKGGLK